MSADDYLERDAYEALVVGSGFGGAVAVARLAQAGVDVAVVERGRRWPPGSFPRDLSRLNDGWLWLCNHGLYDARPLNDILAVQAAGYGGGSLLYANVAMRPPDEVFDDAWPDLYSRSVLDPYYDLVSYMLDIRPVTADPATGELPPKTRFMAAAAERLGQPDGFFHPNLAITFEETGPDHRNRFGVPQRACVFCGECDIGCNVGAKNSLDHTYLALAEQRGAAVGTRTEAVHIARTDDGYRVRLREYGRPGTGKNGAERDITAHYVFLCAGAIGTTELLLRSRDQYRTLPDLPPSLGHGFSGNGDFLSFGRALNTRFSPSSGPTITTASLLHTINAGEQQWFVLEDGGYSKHLANLVANLDIAQLPAAVARAVTTGLRRIMTWSRRVGGALEDSGEHTAALLVMGRDRADGIVSLRGPRHRLHLAWDVAGNDPLYSAESAICGEVVDAFGGRSFGAPTWRMFRQPVTVHNLGGARMGTSPVTGVVDADGEVFGHPGLYVVDGAAIPGPTGANPSLTIAAVAERCIEMAIRRIVGDESWKAPERAEAPARTVPEDKVVRSIVARPARAVATPGVAFRETMSGRVDGHAVTMRLDARIADLRAFLNDPIHRVALGGTIDVVGLTDGPAPVRHGSLHLLAAPEGGVRRTMDYLVPFVDVNGSQWLLRGTKTIERRRRNGPWRATTRLDCAIVHPEERYQTLQPTGRLTISMVGVLRLAASIRPTSTSGIGQSLQTLARLGVFFVGAVAAAYASSAARRDARR